MANTDIEFFTTEELIEEVVKRSLAAAIAVVPKVHDGDTYRIQYAGRVTEVLGLLSMATRNVRAYQRRIENQRRTG